MSEMHCPEMTTAERKALALVIAGRGESANLNSLRSLARKGLVILSVRIVRTSRTGREIDITVKAL